MAAHHPFLSTIDEIIEVARNGGMFILVDDENRENEGDLIIPAQMATPVAINFMARYGRGLICLSLTRNRIEQLGLSPMSPSNGTRHETAFTVSIEAAEGITTGISAADRARTIAVAIDASRGPGHIVSPGHVFPLAARDGGVLVRAGHTEASVDIARLAGLIPAAVICEIMNDDGTMARQQDLAAFAARHDLRIGAIRDLIAYRRRHDRTVRRVAELEFISEWGGAWKAVTYLDMIGGREQIALVKGVPDATRPAMVRMHTHTYLADSFGEISERSGRLRRSMELIAEHGWGALVLINKAVPDAVARGMRARSAGAESFAAVLPELRDYGMGAQILSDLGIHDMILLTNSRRTLVAASGHELNVVGERPIDVPLDGVRNFAQASNK